MTAIAKETDYITPEEYLEGELWAETRHEYINGQVYGMAGSSDDHNRIVFNLARELGNALRGKSCEPFVTDMKVKIPPAFGNIFYYPDLFVTCDPTDNARYYRERPVVIFEVLSESTRTVDEREKVFAYHELPSLQAYVLIDQQRPNVSVLHRLEVGWRREALVGFDAVLKLDRIGLSISLTTLYERTGVLSPPGQTDRS